MVWHCLWHRQLAALGLLAHCCGEQVLQALLTWCLPYGAPQLLQCPLGAGLLRCAEWCCRLLKLLRCLAGCVEAGQEAHSLRLQPEGLPSQRPRLPGLLSVVQLQPLQAGPCTEPVAGRSQAVQWRASAA